ncbi:MAG: RidA family protein [Kutzneria sp.]|nr:RidA family protein [Kutzneria sp.]
MFKVFSNPDTVATPVASYSQAVRVETGNGALVFVCGQLPLDASGQLVGEGDIGAQADQVFQNMRAVLEANGASMDDVVQTTTFLTDITSLPEVNRTRAKHFPRNPPTSTTVAVTALARPEWYLEIEAIAAV